MGTRGAIGFRINGKDKIMYNHFDSYPSALGTDVVNFAKTILNNDSLRKKIEELRAIKKDEAPSPEIIDKATKLDLIDLSVSTQSLDDWYCVLRQAQGDLNKTLDIGIYEDNENFLLDSLFCEYAYIINFDEGEIPVIEFYKGFNKNRDAAGRYAKLSEQNTEYAGVRLVGKCSITNIPKNWIKDIYEHEEEE